MNVIPLMLLPLQLLMQYKKHAAGQLRSYYIFGNCISFVLHPSFYHIDYFYLSGIYMISGHVILLQMRFKMHLTA